MSTRFAEAGPPTDFIRLISASLVGITCFLCLEIIVRLLLRCTRLSLYFWACLIDICAITLHVVLAILINLREMHPYIGILVLVECSWGIFVVGQSIVLYSRLDLVMKNKKLARYVLWTIIFTAVIFGLPTVILEIVADSDTSAHKFLRTLSILSTVQLAVFFLQETAIGILYIHATASYLKNRVSLGGHRAGTRRVLYNLIAINIFIILLDSSLLYVCYARSSHILIKGFYRVTVYVIKLRTEFTILNQLKSTLDGEDSGHHLIHTTRLPPSDEEIGAQGLRRRGSGIELVLRTGIEKKVVFTMTSHAELRDPDKRSSTR